MNQILVTKKLYITPELRRKKKVYKFQFFLSVLLVCLLFSYYIYAEYDRSKSEEVSKVILQDIQINSKKEILNNDDTTQNETVDTTVREYDGMIIVAIDDISEQVTKEKEEEKIAAAVPDETYSSKTGIEYYSEATINIPSLGINYPVITSIDSELSEEQLEELLKISICKYWGPTPNSVGNYCVVGHNYKSGKMFGNLPAIADGEIIELTDNAGRTVKYAVYDRYVIEPNDTQCTSQLTGGKRELTLITCKEYGTRRLVVKAREVK